MCDYLANISANVVYIRFNALTILNYSTGTNTSDANDDN